MARLFERLNRADYLLPTVECCLQNPPYVCSKTLSIDSRACASRKTVLTHAEPEQKTTNGTRIKQQALVVHAMFEAMKVQGFCNDSRHSAAHDSTSQRRCVGLCEWISRA